MARPRARVGSQWAASKNAITNLEMLQARGAASIQWRARAPRSLARRRLPWGAWALTQYRSVAAPARTPPQAAAMLHLITGNGTYREHAERGWRWVAEGPMRRADGLLVDGTTGAPGAQTDCCNGSAAAGGRPQCVGNGGPTYTYNQGMYVGAAALLYRVSSNRRCTAGEHREARVGCGRWVDSAHRDVRPLEAKCRRARCVCACVCRVECGGGAWRGGPFLSTFAAPARSYLEEAAHTLSGVLRSLTAGGVLVEPFDHTADAGPPPCSEQHDPAGAPAAGQLRAAPRARKRRFGSRVHARAPLSSATPPARLPTAQPASSLLVRAQPRTL
eukprot:928819-Prymnesium_polylepis.2